VRSACRDASAAVSTVAATAIPANTSDPVAGHRVAVRARHAAAQRSADDLPHDEEHREQPDRTGALLRSHVAGHDVARRRAEQRAEARARDDHRDQREP